MNKFFNICNFYILLWCIYYLQGIAYASGSIISQFTLLIIMLISGLYFIKTNSIYKLPSFMKVLNIFILMMTIYGVILLADPNPIYKDFILADKIPKIEFLKTLYISLLPIYVMYGFSREGLLKAKYIQSYTIILIIITTLSYFRVEKETLQKAIEMGSLTEDFTNNTGYDFLHILPLLFFWRHRPLTQYALMVYILVFIVMGMKRGAILIGAVCVVWLVYRMYKSSQPKTRKNIIFLTIIFLSIGSSYLIDLYNNSELAQIRIEQTVKGDSSGRDTIYSTLWNYFINQDSILNILFGNGAMKTVMISGNYAHNDWLEIAICQGILGVLIYIPYFITLLSEFKNSKTNKSKYDILGMCIIIMFLSSLFSMSYNSLSLSIAICLGYCLSISNSKIREKGNLFN